MMRKVLLLLMLAVGFSASAPGQGSTAFGNPVVTNGLGQPIAGATVAICTANPGTAPTSLCTSSLATTYTDVTIGTPCTGTKKALNNQAAPSVGSGCSNPGLTDGLGNVIVFSTSATYWCEYTGQGIIGIAVQLCVVPNSGGSGPAGAVLVIPTLTQSQNIIQPSTGGTSAGTSLNANIFEQIRYADQFQWLQSPAGTIAVGANTITINSIRGINVASAPPGVLGSVHLTTKVWIAGTGTPEAVTLTATTCTGASTGTCTITFTAVNSHSAGYTLGSATAGIQEAIADGYWNGIRNNPVPGYTVKLSPYNENNHFVILGSINIDSSTGSAGGVHLDCEGATLEDAVKSAPMIVVGNNGTITPQLARIDNCHFAVAAGLGRAADGSQVYIRDYGQGTSITYNNWDGNRGTADYVDGLVTVSGDQNFEFGHNTINQPQMKCDATFCGWMVFADGTNNAALGTIHENYMNGSDGFNWTSGNGVTIWGNVFQNWYRYPWRYCCGLTSITNLGGNYYEGAAATINPDFGVSGYAQTTGPQLGVSGSVAEYSPGVERGVNALGTHLFSNTGSSVYTYYIVGVKAGKYSRPLFIGTASTNGVTNFNVLFLHFDADTYDVLRTGPALNDGTDSAPYGTGNWAVATGIVCASNPCSFTETFAAPTSYLVREQQALCYTPVITYWPVPLFIMGTTSPSVYRGPDVIGYVNASVSSAYWNYYDGIYTSGGTNPGNTGMRIFYQTPLANGTAGSNNNPGAMILNPDNQSQGMQNRKGRINFPSTSFFGGATWTNNLLVQTYDSEANKTLVTQGHQPLLAAGDHGFGYDNNPTRQATMCGATSCTWYVNHLPDSGTSYKLRLTATALDLPSGSVYSVNGVTLATPSTYNAAGTLQASAHMVEGSCVLGTSCAVTLVGSAVFTGAATYACTAQDATAAAATKIVQASGSAFTITGTGTDALTYVCVGN